MKKSIKLIAFCSAFLLSISGIEGNKFSILFNKLVHYKLIRLNGDNVYPTDKFRKVYNLINKDFKTDIGNKVDQVSGEASKNNNK